MGQARGRLVGGSLLGPSRSVPGPRRVGSSAAFNSTEQHHFVPSAVEDHARPTLGRRRSTRVLLLPHRVASRGRIVSVAARVVRLAGVDRAADCVIAVHSCRALDARTEAAVGGDVATPASPRCSPRRTCRPCTCRIPSRKRVWHPCSSTGCTRHFPPCHHRPPCRRFPPHHPFRSHHPFRPHRPTPLAQLPPTSQRSPRSRMRLTCPRTRNFLRSRRPRTHPRRRRPMCLQCRADPSYRPRRSRRRPAAMPAMAMIEIDVLIPSPLSCERPFSLTGKLASRLGGAPRPASGGGMPPGANAR